MKRIIALILCFFTVFCGCARGETEKEYTSENTRTTLVGTEKEEEAFIGAWLSFMELSVTKERNTKEKYTRYIDGILDNMKEVRVTDIFLHVRPFADAFYNSEIFPVSSYVSSEQGGKLKFDILKLVTERAKMRNMNVHAWINPYRVSSDSDITALCKSNPARMLYKKGSNEDVVVTEKGIYFNPASEKVRRLITDGARELMENYEIKGVHIDDYFYFENCGDFDKKQYESYVKEGGNLSLEDFRRENVNCLLSSLYICVKSFGDDKIFSVSPSGDIDKCRNEFYADAQLWCSSEGYCDMIIPQLYYGFENGRLPFEKCLSRWSDICKSSKVKLVIGLALYKAGKEDAYALSGKREWIENSDIISRQYNSVMEKKCHGIALYSGSYINFSESFLSEELQNLKNVL